MANSKNQNKVKSGQASRDTRKDTEENSGLDSSHQEIDLGK